MGMLMPGGLMSVDMIKVSIESNNCCNQHILYNKRPKSQYKDIKQEKMPVIDGRGEVESQAGWQFRQFCKNAFLVRSNVKIEDVFVGGSDCF